MAIAITIPRLGWNMEEGIFAGWLKRDGEPVRAGEPLFSLEGEKATQDVEAIDAGILRIPPTAPAVGDTVAVGAVIGYLLRPGEAAAGRDRPAPAASRVARPSPSAAADAPPRPPGHGDRPPSIARWPAGSRASWASTGRASAAAARRAESARSTSSRPPQRPSDRRAADPARSIAVGPARRTIAARMVESRQTTAPVTLTTTVDATNLVEPPPPVQGGRPGRSRRAELHRLRRQADRPGPARPPAPERPLGRRPDRARRRGRTSGSPSTPRRACSSR